MTARVGTGRTPPDDGNLDRVDDVMPCSVSPCHRLVQQTSCAARRGEDNPTAAGTHRPASLHLGGAVANRVLNLEGAMGLFGFERG